MMIQSFKKPDSTSDDNFRKLRAEVALIKDDEAELFYITFLYKNLTIYRYKFKRENNRGNLEPNTASGKNKNQNKLTFKYNSNDAIDISQDNIRDLMSFSKDSEIKMDFSEEPSNEGNSKSGNISVAGSWEKRDEYCEEKKIKISLHYRNQKLKKFKSDASGKKVKSFRCKT